MKLILIVLFACFFQIVASGQNYKEINAIVAEGKKLYRSEIASWYGTDIFLEKFKELKEQVGGYFSYADKEITRCVFYSKGLQPKILVTFSFDSTNTAQSAVIDNTERALSEYENRIYLIRIKALAEIKSDTLFKRYANSNLNVVPLIEGNNKKVYVFTGPQRGRVVIFGNDYLLSFDKRDNVIEKKCLHKNILSIQSDKTGDTVISTLHTHLPKTGDYITATDICTLMLYERFTTWKQHYVISQNYISIWDCVKNSLFVMTRKVWDKINNDRSK